MCVGNFCFEAMRINDLGREEFLKQKRVGCAKGNAVNPNIYVA
jgi:hypothetical protein